MQGLCTVETVFRLYFWDEDDQGMRYFEFDIREDAENELDKYMERAEIK